MKPPSRSILYVEDDKDTRELVTFVLSNEGYTVKACELGHYALTLALSQSFDLYLIDNWLPDITGVRLCQKLREVDLTTPILFYSGAALQADKEAAFAAGAQGYMTKPASVEELLSEVRRFVGGALSHN